MNKIIHVISTFFILVSPALSKTHVFWYKAKSNNYSVTDCNPGPCLPKDAIIHEGKVVSGTQQSRDNSFENRISFGNRLNEFNMISFCWFEDLNRIESGDLTTAKVAVEYDDYIWRDGNFCVPGKIKLRCGVIDFGGNIKAWKGIPHIPEDAKWVDIENKLHQTMGLHAQTEKLAAEEIKIIEIKRGREMLYQESKLDGQFLSIDVTQQVKWIIRHDGQYAIVFISQPIADNPKGLALCWADEAGDLPESRNFPYYKSWTKDGNSLHLRLISPSDKPLKFIEESKRAVLPKQKRIRWKHPAPHIMARSDSIPIELEMHVDLGKKIERVIYLVYYLQKSDTGFIAQEKTFIANTYPFSALLKDSLIADQSYGRIMINYNLIPKHPLKIKDIPLKGECFAGVDRHPTISTKPFKSEYTKAAHIRLDGYLDEWPSQFVGSFKNNDNQIFMHSCWDSINLYFGFLVQDNQVRSDFFPEAKSIMGLYDQDEIEIFIDPQNNQSEIMDPQYKQFLISAGGMVYECIRDSGRERIHLKPKCDVETRVLGTINNMDDADSGYIVELAIPWNELSLSPNIGMTLGIDFLNGDMDSSAIQNPYATWSGNVLPTLHNPSEWGDLVLIKKASMKRGMVVIILLCCFAAAILLAKFLVFKQPVIEDNMVQEKVAKAKTFIQEKYSDPKLTLKQVAGHCFISPSYLSTLFRQEEGTGFNQYVVNFRIHMAEELLIKSSKRVSEIAFDVGFGTVEHFLRTFKKIKKLTPSDYRHSRQPKDKHS